MTIKNIILAFVFLFAILASPVAAGSLTGKVVDAMSMGGIANAQVNVYDSGNVLVSQLTSAADGTFSLANATGHYTVRVVDTGYSSSSFTADVGASSAVDMGNLLLVPQATIHAVVNDNASAPLANGFVRVMQGGNEVVARLDGASGNLYVSPGDYDVIFSAPFHAEQSYHVSLAPAGTITVTSTLEPTAVDTTPVVQSVAVGLSSATVNAGSEVTLTATATYNDGHQEDVTSAATWNSGGAGTIYSPKLVAASAGAHSVSALFGGKSGTSTLTVNFGQVRSLSLQASNTNVYTTDPVSLTALEVDQYGNGQATANVDFGTSCGVVQGSTFSSQNACTATVTATSRTNASLIGSVTILVTKKDTSSNYDPSKRRTSGTGSDTNVTPTGNNTGTDTGTNTGNSGTEPTKPPLSGSTVLKFVLPESAYVGDTIEINVLDSNSNPVDGVVVTVVMPDGRSVSLVTKNGGKLTFVPATTGDYTFKSSKYAISGTNVVTVKEVPLVSKPPIKPLNMSQNQGGDVDAASGVSSDMLGAILAVFAGEMSPADAIKATMPLWTILGALIFAAAIFFVVYTYMVGNAQPHDEHMPAHAEQNQRVRVTVGDMATRESVSPSESVAAAPAMAQKEPRPAKEKAPKEPREQPKKADSEIDGLEFELREKMARLKRLKEERGY